MQERLTEQQELNIAESILKPEAKEIPLKLKRKDKIRGIKGLITEIKAKATPGNPLTPEDIKNITQLEKELWFVRANKFESKEFVFTPSPKRGKPFVNAKKREEKEKPVAKLSAPVKYKGISHTIQVKEMYRMEEEERIRRKKLNQAENEQKITS